jgi:hypothetical protein
MYLSRPVRLLRWLPISLAACSLDIDPSYVRDGGPASAGGDGGDEVLDGASAPDSSPTADGETPPPIEAPSPGTVDGGLACSSDDACPTAARCSAASQRCAPRCTDDLGCFVWAAPSPIRELASDGTRVYFSTLGVRDDVGNLTSPGTLYAWDGEHPPVALLETEVTTLVVVESALYVFTLGAFVGEHHTGELVRVVEGAVTQTEPVASNVTWVWASGRSLYWSELVAGQVTLQRSTSGGAPESLLERPVDAFNTTALRVGWFNGDDGHALRYVRQGNLGSTLTADDLASAAKSVDLTEPFGGFSWSPTLVADTRVYTWTEAVSAPLRVLDIADPAAGYLLGGASTAEPRGNGSLALRDGSVLWSAVTWTREACLFGRSEDRAEGQRELLVSAPTSSPDPTCRFTLRDGRLVYASDAELYERALPQ